MFLAARFFSGVGMGAFLAIVPMYQAEVATPESRGFVVSTIGVMFAVGNALAVWVNVGTYIKGVKEPASEFAWRFPLAMQLLPAVILLAGSPILPPSPRWLILRDRHEEALAVLQRLHGNLGDQAGNYANREYHQMSKQITFDRLVAEKIGRFPIVRTASNRRRVFLAFNLLWGTKFLGLTTVGIYGVLVYESLGIKGSLPLILQAIWVTITIPRNLINTVLVDRVGRRPLLLCGTCGILLCVVLNAILQGLYIEPQYAPGLKASSTCIDSTQFVYISEIFPSYIRAPGQAIGTLGLALANVIFLVAAPIALAAIHWKFYLVNICWTVPFIGTIYFCYPESTGKSIEDLSTGFGDTVVVSFEETIFDVKREAAGDGQIFDPELFKESALAEEVESTVRAKT